MGKSRLFGDWDLGIRSLEQVTKKVDREIKRQTKRAGILARDAVVKLIRDQNPTWPELKDATIARKGSSKMLIDHGDLMNAVTYKIVDHTSVFVGVLRNARRTGARAEAEPLVNIARIHEFGFLGMVQAGGRTYLLRIPARPYLLPTMRKISGELYRDWKKAIARVIEDLR